MAPSTVPLLLCLALGGTSWFLGHFVARRRFYRRNACGMETFPSYRAAAISTAFESALIIIAQLFRGFGIGLFLMFAMMRCGEAYDTSPVQVVHARAVRRYHGKTREHDSKPFARLQKDGP